MVFFARTRIIPIIIFFIVLLSGYALAETKLIAPFSDVRWSGIPGVELGNTVLAGTFRPEDVATFWYDSYTVFEGSEAVAEAILQAGKNPGLGVRSLHARGITGKNIRVAIIDQPTVGEHSEYKNKIIEYNNMAGNVFEMHGPAVASLLVGDECGTAPGAKLYFAAIPTWELDTAYFAEALRWIISKNNELPEGDKIRVVSVSAAPSGSESPYIRNTEQWDIAVAEAKTAGILVLDCRMDYLETGFTIIGYFDINDPENIRSFTPGFPARQDEDFVSGRDYLYAPGAYRTQAQEHQSDRNYWQYTGDGGVSWSIPYVAGVLAMGWQIDSSLSNERMVYLLKKTAYVNSTNHYIIDPVAFINEIENPTPDPSDDDDHGEGGGGCTSVGFISLAAVAASLFLLKRGAQAK